MQSLRTDELNETPDELEHTVALICKSANQSESGVAHAMTLRVPTFAYATTRAMAEYSGNSINKIALQLLRVGIDAVLEELPADEAHAIHALRSEIIREVMHPGQTRLSLGDDE